MTSNVGTELKFAVRKRTDITLFLIILTRFSVTQLIPWGCHRGCLPVFGIRCVSRPGRGWKSARAAERYTTHCSSEHGDKDYCDKSWNLCCRLFCPAVYAYLIRSLDEPHTKPDIITRFGFFTDLGDSTKMNPVLKNLKSNRIQT